LPLALSRPIVFLGPKNSYDIILYSLPIHCRKYTINTPGSTIKTSTTVIQ
jgi:hypothetical protein